MSSISTGKAIEMQSTEDFNRYRDNCGDMLLVVDFYADWCGPCKIISPLFKELAQDNPDVCFIQVNVDDLDEVAAMCQVECMPTFQFYKNGKLLDKFAGANKDTLKAAVLKHKK